MNETSTLDLAALAAGLSPTVAGRTRTFVCHRGRLSGRHPDNSLAAIEECVAAGVPRVEIDVHVVNADLALVHHDASINGRLLADHYRSAPVLPADEPVIVPLEEYVDRVIDSPTLLQVDLKSGRLLSDVEIATMARVLRPLGERVIVGSQYHWNVRRLAAEGVPVALDPHPALRWSPERPMEDLPHRLGVHGFWDDSAVAQRGDIPADDYIEERLRDLASIVPGLRELMIDYQSVLAMLDVGARLPVVLDSYGVRLTVWTLREPELAQARTLLPRLLEADVTTFITDDPIAFAAALRELEAEA